MVAATSLLVESPYIRTSRRTHARCRLICLPHAGAGASTFNDWPGLLPPEVEVVGVQLPGRQDRIKEKPFTDISRLVVTVTHVIRPLLDLPVAFFGHSGGALLAFEVARALQRRGEADIVGVFPSGQGAPDLPLPPPLHHLPGPQFQCALEQLGGTAAQLAGDAALMTYLEPSLRADFRLWDSYQYRPGPPLAAPLLAFGGREDDRAPGHAIEAWGEHTSAPFAFRMFPGGHFFIDAFTAEVAEALGHTLLHTI